MNHYWLVGAIVVAVFVRLLCLFAVEPTKLMGDEVDHFIGAQQFAAGEPISVIPVRPPAYILFAGVVLRSGFESSNAIRFIQCVLEGLTTLGVFWLGTAVFDRRAGLSSAWLYSLSPEFISYSHYLWTECLLVLTLVFGLLALLRFQDRASMGNAFAVGLIWGLLTLLKPFHIYFLPLLLGWTLAWRSLLLWIGRVERKCKNPDEVEKPSTLSAYPVAIALLATAITALVISPWCYFENGRFVMVSTQGNRVLRAGTNYFPPPQFDFSYVRNPSVKLRERLDRHEGIVDFVLNKPALFASRSVEKLANLFAPNSFLIRHLYAGYYGPVKEIPRPVRYSVVFGTMLWIMLVLGCAVCGLLTASNLYFLGISLIYSACTIGMVLLAVSLSRYRLPLMIFGILYSAKFLSDVTAHRFRFDSPAQSRGLFAVAIVLVALWSIRVPGILAETW